MKATRQRRWMATFLFPLTGFVLTLSIVVLASQERFSPAIWGALFLAIVVAVVISIIMAVRYNAGLTQLSRELARIVDQISPALGQRLIASKADDLNSLKIALAETCSDLNQRLYETRKVEKRLQAVLRHTVSGLAFLETRGRILMINPAAEELFGLQPEGAVGKHYLEVMRNCQLSAIIDTAAETGEVATGKVSLSYPRERTLQVHIVPVGEGQGESEGFVAVFHDITALVRLENMRAELVANVSHELRTPLTTIRGFTETLLAGAWEDKENAERFLRIIAEEACRLTVLLDDLLNLSKLELGRADLEWEVVRLDSLLMSIEEILFPRLQQGGLKLTCNGVDHIAIRGDRNRIRQILINLIDNSIKHTAYGGRITVTAEAKEDVVVIAVLDSGSGVPERYLDRLFERFFRVDKARSRQDGGTGLGLAIAKHIVELHGGRIWAENGPGQGLRVLFTLPVAS